MTSSAGVSESTSSTVPVSTRKMAERPASGLRRSQTESRTATLRSATLTPEPDDTPPNVAALSPLSTTDEIVEVIRSTDCGATIVAAPATSNDSSRKRRTLPTVQPERWPESTRTTGIVRRPAIAATRPERDPLATRANAEMTTITPRCVTRSRGSATTAIRLTAAAKPTAWWLENGRLPCAPVSTLTPSANASPPVTPVTTARRVCVACTGECR